MSGGGEWVGTPFDDTFIDAAGNYTINGGGGQDYFQINQDSDEVAVSFAARRLLAVSSYDSTTLRRRQSDRKYDSHRLHHYQSQ